MGLSSTMSIFIVILNTRPMSITSHVCFTCAHGWWQTPGTTALVLWPVLQPEVFSSVQKAMKRSGKSERELIFLILKKTTWASHARPSRGFVPHGPFTRTGSCPSPFGSCRSRGPSFDHGEVWVRLPCSAATPAAPVSRNDVFGVVVQESSNNPLVCRGSRRASHMNCWRCGSCNMLTMIPPGDCCIFGDTLVLSLGVFIKWATVPL